MPMTINFDEKAVKALTSPPKPCQPLRDIVLTIKKSSEINSLAMMGRSILRCCVSARRYQPPIASTFDIEVDQLISDTKLAKVAENSGLLQRLNVDGVAIKPTDVAHILFAYLGAVFEKSFRERGVNTVDDSINDFCSMVLEEEEPTPTENTSSHKNLLSIPGVEQMTPLKEERVAVTPAPPSRAASEYNGFDEIRSSDSVSSGRSPPPLSYGAHYQQPYQPYYPHNPSMPQHMHPHPPPQRFTSFIPVPMSASTPPFMQPQPQYPAQAPPQAPAQSNTMPRGGYDPYAGMGMPPGGPPGYGAQIPPIPQMPPQMPPPPPPPAQMQQSQGFISLFNELAMKNRMAVSWQQQKSGQQHIPEWTMWLLVDGHARGYGTAPTKQAAKEVAAKAALQTMGWLNT